MELRPCGTVRRCAREILIVPKRRRRVRDTCDAGSRGHQRTLMGRRHYDLMIVVMTISMKTVIRMLMLVLRTLVLRMRMLWTTQCWRRRAEIQGDITDVGGLEVEVMLEAHSSARRRTWSRLAARGPVRKKRRVVLHVPRSGDGRLAWPEAALVTRAADWRR